ncbi:hypothetical protein [Vallitalea okinawensis]|uniref:hypothetical protein n=1 Tax=Vallitalea okinawensis TaxID=2078660 RepID=UPI000CFD02C9|nr:hypothetical protein [Vallitalea okinawensis]
MSNTDIETVIDEEVFSYRLSKDKKVFLYWHGKQVKILRGKESDKFIKRVTSANPQEAQLIMAKITGNFKRGNEKNAKKEKAYGI